MNRDGCFTVDLTNVVYETVDGEVVLIALDSGSYFSLRGGAADVFGWALAGDSAADIERRVRTAHGDVAAAAARRVLGELVGERLLVACASDAAAATPAHEGAPTWAPPTIEKFTDMQDYLRMDPIHEVSPAGWPNVKGG